MQVFRTETQELAKAMLEGLAKSGAVVYQSRRTGHLLVKVRSVEIVLLRDAAAAYIVAGGVSFCETEKSVLRTLREAFDRTRIMQSNESFTPLHGRIEPSPGRANNWFDLVHKLAAHLRSL